MEGDNQKEHPQSETQVMCANSVHVDTPTQVWCRMGLGIIPEPKDQNKQVSCFRWCPPKMAQRLSFWFPFHEKGCPQKKTRPHRRLGIHPRPTAEVFSVPACPSSRHPPEPWCPGCPPCGPQKRCIGQIVFFLKDPGCLERTTQGVVQTMSLQHN